MFPDRVNILKQAVFQLMEARNRFISAKAELVRVRLQVEMMMKLEKYYREGTFL